MLQDRHEPESYGRAQPGAITRPADRSIASPRTRWIAAGLLVAALAGLALLSQHHPAHTGVLPRCPTEQYTHLACPGCGATRATHFLLNANIAQALRHNPLFVIVGVPAGLWLFWRTAVMAVTGRHFMPERMLPAWVGWSAVVVVVGFTLVRNLPTDWAEKLRPPEPVPMQTTEASELI